MGVSGCGKTTVGILLAERLGWDFYDADDFHSPENIAKMAAGIPLRDDDRLPWLATLHKLIFTCLDEGRPGILACSALKERYRKKLLAGNPNVRLVYLKGDFSTIIERMQARSRHYMKPDMLQSQFDALEEPLNAITISISFPVEEIVSMVISQAC